MFLGTWHIASRFLAIMAVCALLVAPAGAHKASKVFSTARDSAVFLRADLHFEPSPDIDAPPEDKADQDICSGFAIAAGRAVEDVVTARHCVEPHPQTFMGVPTGTLSVVPKSVHFFDGDIGRIERIFVSSNSDVAI